MSESINKVFGIGAHKTATTSLSDALNILDISCIHWDHYESSRDDLKHSRYDLPILESYQAMTDLPVPAIYRHLDRTYPNSKFILTIRDEAQWLESVKRHLERTNEEFSRNGLRFIYEEFLFYHQWTFQPEQALRRFREHQQEVMRYFNDRSDDLLVMDIPNGDGWEKLCPFLGRPTPDLPFPASNVDTEVGQEDDQPAS